MKGSVSYTLHRRDYCRSISSFVRNQKKSIDMSLPVSTRDHQRATSALTFQVVQSCLLENKERHLVTKQHQRHQSSLDVFNNDIITKNLTCCACLRQSTKQKLKKQINLNSPYVLTELSMPDGRPWIIFSAMNDQRLINSRSAAVSRTEPSTAISAGQCDISLLL
jgi:hypothetical protein